jgi:hypothetical protein
VFQTPKIIKKAAQVAIYTVAASFVFSYWLSALLKYLLSLIASLSIIMHMFLINLNYPVQMMKFFGTIFPLIVFDIFPTSIPNENIFHFAEIFTDYGLSDQFSIAGYQSIFSVNNIGSLHFMILVGLFTVFTFWLAKKFSVCNCSRSLQKLFEKVTNKVLWSGATLFCT